MNPIACAPMLIAETFEPDVAKYANMNISKNSRIPSMMKSNTR